MITSVTHTSYLNWCLKWPSSFTTHCFSFSLWDLVPFKHDPIFNKWLSKLITVPEWTPSQNEHIASTFILSTSPHRDEEEHPETWRIQQTPVSRTRIGASMWTHSLLAMKLKSIVPWTNFSHFFRFLHHMCNSTENTNSSTFFSDFVSMYCVNLLFSLQTSHISNGILCFLHGLLFLHATACTYVPLPWLGLFTLFSAMIYFLDSCIWYFFSFNK